MFEPGDILLYSDDYTKDEESPYVNICTGSTKSQQLAEAALAKKTIKTIEELILEQYRGYMKVFNEQASMRVPEHKTWDHAIDLKPDFTPKSCKVYPLSPSEQQELDRFLNEQLGKGYICPSKSPQASPFFFVKKKDGHLRPVQDY